MKKAMDIDTNANTPYILQKNRRLTVEGDSVIKKSAALRGAGRFDEAIKLIENNIDFIDINIHVNAWLEAFYAAKEKKDKTLIIKYAQMVATKDPNIPSIQEYL